MKPKTDKMVVLFLELSSGTVIMDTMENTTSAPEFLNKDGKVWEFKSWHRIPETQYGQVQAPIYWEVLN